MMKALVTGIAASALMATPVLAQTAPAVAERTPAPVSASEEVVGSGMLIGLLAALAAIGVIIVVSDDDDEDDLPASP